MSARLTSDFWVSAYRRRAESAGAFVYVRRKGAAEAGAIALLVRDALGLFQLYLPAPQSDFDERKPQDRLFRPAFEVPVESEQAEAKLAREQKFDSDLWIIEIEDRDGRAFLD